VEEKHDVFDLLTKNQLDLVHILGEKKKSSPTGKFAVHAVIGVANSNSMKNLSYGKASSCQGRFKWYTRSYLDMRYMCFISRSSRMTCFKRHLSQ
jgi:hypothetical protein